MQKVSSKDKEILRKLAVQKAEIASLPVNEQRALKYFLNAFDTFIHSY